MDFGELYFFTFSWLKKRESLKYAFFAWLAGAFMVLATCLQIILTLGSLEAFEYISSADINSVLFSDIFLTILFFLIYFFAFLAIDFLVTIFALRSKNYSVAPISLHKFLKYVVLLFWISVVAIFSWYNKKWLIVLGAAILLGASGIVMLSAGGLAVIVAVILLILTFLCLIAYLILVYYNMFRLFFSGMFFLIREQSIAKSVQDSWRATSGKVLEIFAGYIIFLIFVLVLGVIIFLISLLLLIAMQSSSNFATLFVPTILDHIIQPIIIISTAFLFVGLFSQIVGRSPVGRRGVKKAGKMKALTPKAPKKAARAKKPIKAPVKLK